MRAKWGGHFCLAGQIRGREVKKGVEVIESNGDVRGEGERPEGARSEGGREAEWAVESNSPRMSICAC
jgi:hypothetical protein